MTIYREYKIQKTFQGFAILWSGGILEGKFFTSLEDAKREIDALLHHTTSTT